MCAAAPVYFSSPVKPGDAITATVSATAAGVFTLKIADVTEGWSHTVTKSAAGAARSSAEVVVEVAGVVPIAPAASVTFTGARVNGGTLGAANPTLLASGPVTCGAIVGGTRFTCTW